MAFPSRRAVLAALAVGGVLAVIATLIVRTSAPHPAEPPAEPRPAERAPGSAPEAARNAPVVPAPAAPSDAAPSDADAERALSLEIRELVAAGHVGKARSRAVAYYARFPSGPSGPELERLTGAHPTRDATGTRP